MGVYGRFILVGVVLVIGAAAGGKAGTITHLSRIDSSHRYRVAENLLREGKPDDALTLFSDLSRKGFGSYQKLAEIRKAALLRDSETLKGRDIYEDFSRHLSKQNIKDTASLNLVLTKFQGPIRNCRVWYLICVPSLPRKTFRFSALEVLGLLELKRGDKKSAELIFKKLADALEAPEPIAGSSVSDILNSH